MTAENVSADYKVSRADQDQFAFESNQKAVKAISGGLFKNEIIPIKVQSRSPKEGGKVDIKEIVSSRLKTTVFDIQWRQPRVDRGCLFFSARILVRAVATHITHFSPLFFLVSESNHTHTENSFKISATDMH